MTDEGGGGRVGDFMGTYHVGLNSVVVPAPPTCFRAAPGGLDVRGGKREAVAVVLGQQRGRVPVDS